MPRHDHHNRQFTRYLGTIALALFFTCTGGFKGNLTQGYIDRYPHIEQEITDAAHGSYAITYNFKDKRRLYEYRISNRRIEWRINKGDWSRLPKGNPVVTIDGQPETLSVDMIAADNNRLLAWGKASNGKVALFWYCVKYDQATWVSKLLKRFRRLVKLFMKKDYYAWTSQVHQENTWTNALRLRNDQFDTTTVMRIKKPGNDSIPSADNMPLYTSLAEGEWMLSRKLPGDTGSLDANDIGSIAAGNWNGTVVTYYIFFRSARKIYYIDEEVVMDTLRVVPRIVGSGKNNPYPLPENTLIDASNSVLFCAKPSSSGTSIHFIRWDFHNYEDFKFWRLNWCENDWHVLQSPIPDIKYMRAYTNDIRSCSSKGVWDIPRSALGFNYGGLFGNVKNKDISTYPVTLFIAGESGDQWVYHTDSVRQPGKWTQIR